MPAYCHPAAFAAFQREMPNIDTTDGLFRAAFAIARHEHPGANVSQAEATIMELANTVLCRVHSPNVDARLAHLHDMLFEVAGFSGNIDDYYNPANSYLPEVLRTHRGLPITLVLIYKCVAEHAGLMVRGVNSPGHFLAAVQTSARTGKTTEGDAAWMYVDPFFRGELLNENDVCRRIVETTGALPDVAAQLLPIATHRQWLSRILNNLQAVFAHTGRERDLYAMQELQELLAT
jgi:regulator of sirC expression with transglutaminase-like and TPR domain